MTIVLISFNVAVDYVLYNEGGLEENPNDPAGITHYGISLRFLKSIPYDTRKLYDIRSPEITEDDIKNLTVEQAKNIYLGEFWHHAPFEQLPNQGIANYLFDMAVNMGIAPAIKCIQRACWAVLKDRSVIIDDGLLGITTLDLIHRCSFFILPALRAERAGYYRLVAKENPNEKEFLDDWLKRTYKNEKLA